MDRIILQHHSLTIGGGLRWCESLDLAFQDHQSRSVPYDENYFDRHAAYDGTKINNQIVASRTSSIVRNVGRECPILDIGSGSGGFLLACRESGLPICGGYDINPRSIQWLQEREMWFDPYRDKLPDGPIAWTMWDVLEHLRSPHELLDRVRVGDALFLTVPIYADVRHQVLGSKHYRPDEHYYYFTPHGLIRWLGASNYGFRLLEMHRDEQLAGREDVMSFAFLK